MKYLKKERELFAAVKKEFWECYKRALREALEIAEERGASLDTGSPLHHRMSSEGMAHEIGKKNRRIQGVLEQGFTEGEDYRQALAKIVEESTDIINYAAFLAAYTTMLLVDATGREE